MLFTESIICCSPGDDWNEWLEYLGEKREAAIEKIQMWAPTYNTDLGGAVDRLFKGLDLLPNVKTLYVREDIFKPKTWVEEKIAHESQTRGLEVFFERNLSRLDE
jgi:hypothetical protein